MLIATMKLLIMAIEILMVFIKVKAKFMVVSVLILILMVIIGVIAIFNGGDGDAGGSHEASFLVNEKINLILRFKYEQSFLKTRLV